MYVIFLTSSKCLLVLNALQLSIFCYKYIVHLLFFPSG